MLIAFAFIYLADKNVKINRAKSWERDPQRQALCRRAGHFAATRRIHAPIPCAVDERGRLWPRLHRDGRLASLVRNPRHPGLGAGHARHLLFACQSKPYAEPNSFTRQTIG